LLNQLIVDLGVQEAALRPASMRDVLDRLDQLEAFVAPAPEADRATVGSRTHAAPVPVRAEAPAGRPVRHRSPTLGVKLKRAWAALVLTGIVVAAVLFLANLRTPTQPTEAQAPPAPATTEVSDEPPGPVSTPADEEAAAERAAIVAAARQAAEEALNAYLAVRGEADAIGAGAWKLEAYGAAANAAAEADRAFLEEAFETAATAYRKAAEGFTAVLAARADVLDRLLLDGRTAIAAPDSAAATTAFEGALLIDPSSAEAKVGLQRAATLDELHRLLDRARAHEQQGRLAFAYADFSAAAHLDPHAEEAARAVSRLKDRIKEEEFRAMMSAGLEAFHRGDYDEARRRIVEARTVRPDAPEVAQTLAMIDEARLRREVTRLHAQALAHEQAEQWQAARASYRQVLAIDAAVQFAQEGLARSERIIELEQRTGHYLQRPDLLVKRGSREDAVRLVEKLGSVEDMGPKLRASYAQLAEAVREANTPRRVLLRSDEKTKVDVYQVGRYGAFRTMELELLPGEYTVVGHRKGYKDVRLTLQVEPRDEPATLEVVCKESI
jgi:hypothetical protein